MWLPQVLNHSLDQDRDGEGDRSMAALPATYRYRMVSAQRLAQGSLTEPQAKAGGFEFVRVHGLSFPPGATAWASAICAVSMVWWPPSTRPFRQPCQ